MQALGRLSEREAYDRIHRFRVASQQSILHKNLPKEQWLKPEEVCSIRVQIDCWLKSLQDIRYLKPHVVEVWKEDIERAKWDKIEVQRKR